MSQIVSVKCLKHTYSNSVEVSLCGLDFVVNQGDRVAILGPNGSGKSTLLAHIIGLLTASEGTIEVFGMNPKDRFQEVISKIGVVFQNVDDQIIGPTVFDDIAFTLRNRGFDERETASKVKAIMEEIGISKLKDRMPHNLSGGEKKKVALAGALVTDPRLLILDESFEGLDQRSKRDMADIILKVNREKGTTVIVTTHDVGLVWRFADVVYLINHNEIVGRGNPIEIFSDLKGLEPVDMAPPGVLVLFSLLREMGYSLDRVKDENEAAIAIDELIKRQLFHR